MSAKSNIPQWMWEEYDLHNHPDLVRILETRYMPWDEMVRTYAPDLVLPVINIERWMPQ